MIDLPGGEVLEGQQPYEALYIHIPFCKSKCAYCDFASEAISADDPRIEAYIDELILSIRATSRADLLGDLKTVYIGGGTPTHIGNKQLSRLLYALSLSMHLTPEVECTLEVNPESLTEAMVKDLFALGVTRLSFGVQSFDDAVLATLGRAHDAEQARKGDRACSVAFREHQSRSDVRHPWAEHRFISLVGRRGSFSWGDSCEHLSAHDRRRHAPARPHG